MRKGDFVVELGDDAHVGQIVAKHPTKQFRLVRWHRSCARWYQPAKLRLANEAEIARAKLAQPSTEKEP